MFASVLKMKWFMYIICILNHVCKLNLYAIVNNTYFKWIRYRWLFMAPSLFNAILFIGFAISLVVKHASLKSCIKHSLSSESMYTGNVTL